MFIVRSAEACPGNKSATTSTGHFMRRAYAKTIMSHEERELLMPKLTLQSLAKRVEALELAVAEQARHAKKD
jgi:hypothetical protein